MQAAGLVSTFRPRLAGRAQVTFFNQADLGTCDVGPFHHAPGKFLHDLFQRLLVRQLQQYLGDEIGIEAVVAGWLHNWPKLPEGGAGGQA